MVVSVGGSSASCWLNDSDPSAPSGENSPTGIPTQKTRPDHMPWFKVDDSFHSHPKVLATEPAALGLWVVAGAWSSANLTEGFVPDHVLPRLLTDSATLAAKLVNAGLWKRVRGGHQFHDWAEYNPTKDAVLAERKSNADRQKRWREAQRNGRSNGVTTPVINSVSNGTPTRPDPTPIGGSSLTLTTDRARGAPEPPRRCPRHLEHPDPPACGSCADARRAHDRWTVEQGERRRAAPQCERHRGQLASSCALCRSEALGAA